MAGLGDGKPEDDGEPGDVEPAMDRLGIEQL
jgi:hypothetical protein